MGAASSIPNDLTHQPSLAIFCRTLKENDDPFSSDYYWQAYQDLMLALKERGIEVYLAADESTYVGNGVFTKAYTIDHKRQLTDLIMVENAKVDVVFNRGDFGPTDVLTINDPFVQKIGMSKIEMFKHFAKFQPFSIICDDIEAVKTAFAKIEGDKIVVKEPEGYGGHNVYIGDKTEVINRLPNNYPLIVQEFLDTSMGIPGVAEGVHDVRLSLCGGELIGCYVRQAKPGELHSNVSQGGKMLFISIEQAPQEAVAAALQIDKLFEQFPRYYSADFVNTDKGWRLLEINPQLALLPVTDGPEPTKTLSKLADYLARVCKDIASK
jgi:glutathione synthase/RimK-type ligase-like ATP-grasp enzyme